MNGGEHGKRVLICLVFILFWVQTRDQFQTETCLLFVSLYRHSGRLFSGWMDFRLRLKRCTFSVSEVRLDVGGRTDSHRWSSVFDPFVIFRFDVMCVRHSAAVLRPHIIYLILKHSDLTFVLHILNLATLSVKFKV